MRTPLLAFATLDLALRQDRAFLGVNPQHCFVLLDMARESGAMSSDHDRGCVHLTDLVDRESRRRRRPQLTMRSRISSS